MSFKIIEVSFDVIDDDGEEEEFGFEFDELPESLQKALIKFLTEDL